MAQAFLGRHREALVSGAEGLRIAHDTGQPLWVSYTSGMLAYLAAIGGDEPACRQHADQAALGATVPQSTRAGTTLAEVARALLDLGLGRIQDAFDRLRAIVEGPYHHQSAVVRCVPDLVEAAVRLGRSDEVAEPLARYARWADTMGRPWIDALLARCRAMTAPDSEPDYLGALARHESGSRGFERARTELLYGEWLRRSRRRSDARVQLDAARRTFEELGAAPWTARARTSSARPVSPCRRPQRLTRSPA